MKFNLYPIYALSLDPPFDLTTLPFLIAENVYIEEVNGRFREDCFDLWREAIGTQAFRALTHIRFALVHRYDVTPGRNLTGVQLEGQIDQHSQNMLRSLDACLRLIRPMRQAASLIWGDVRDQDGTFAVRGFETPPLDFIDVPEAQKLNRLRNRDAADLRTHAPIFLKAMRGEFWKFRMAIQFHQLGHFQPLDWKARYLLWCSAIESLYTSHSPEHRGSLVAKSRIRYFLGDETQIYEPSHPWDTPQTLRIKDILDDLYEQRNYIAHGDKIPDAFFNEIARHGIAGPVRKPEMLLEAASFIIRTSLLKILREDLLSHFVDAGPAEMYFAARNLTKSALQTAH